MYLSTPLSPFSGLFGPPPRPCFCCHISEPARSNGPWRSFYGSLAQLFAGSFLLHCPYLPGCRGRARTCTNLINSEELSQLSYPALILFRFLLISLLRGLFVAFLFSLALHLLFSVFHFFPSFLSCPSPYRTGKPCDEKSSRTHCIQSTAAQNSFFMHPYNHTQHYRSRNQP